MPPDAKLGAALPLAAEPSAGAPGAADRAPSLLATSRRRRSRARPIRRVARPRMGGMFDSPVRNLIVGLAFTLSVMVAATLAYMAVGWSFRDAVYMVITTVYTVGYGEVRPIDTPVLDAITIALVLFGCTGIIFLTGALVQFITLNQQGVGLKRMNRQIEELQAHVVICGFGRLGAELARSLMASSAGFVIIEANETKALAAREQGYLCVHGDATKESVLMAGGVARAHALAAVLSNDALNVFITLSARALNADLQIVARGELASTEGKLLQAGADRVVLPTHIGAERIAELILFEASARKIDHLERAHGFQRVLRNFGVELEVVTAAAQSAAARQTVASIERQGKGAFFIVQINRADGTVLAAPDPDTVVADGDGVVLMGRANRASLLAALFEPRQRLGPRG